MTEKIIPFKARRPGGGIPCSSPVEDDSPLNFAAGERADAADQEVIGRIFAVEQSQCIEWRIAFHAYFDREPLP
jgi:hypothetical protein